MKLQKIQSGNGIKRDERKPLSVTGAGEAVSPNKDGTAGGAPYPYAECVLGGERKKYGVGQWFLLISCRRVQRYVAHYHRHDKSEPGKRGGSEPHRNEEQTQALTAQISKTIMKSTGELVECVHKTFGVEYSRGGMAKWLWRQGFRYKRPHRVPRSMSVEKQEMVVKWCREKKASLKEDEIILWGRIYKGKRVICYGRN